MQLAAAGSTPGRPQAGPDVPPSRRLKRGQRCLRRIAGVSSQRRRQRQARARRAPGSGPLTRTLVHPLPPAQLLAATQFGPRRAHEARWRRHQRQDGTGAAGSGAGASAAYRASHGRQPPAVPTTPPLAARPVRATRARPRRAPPPSAATLSCSGEQQNRHRSPLGAWSASACWCTGPPRAGRLGPAPDRSGGGPLERTPGAAWRPLAAHHDDRSRGLQGSPASPCDPRALPGSVSRRHPCSCRRQRAPPLTAATSTRRHTPGRSLAARTARPPLAQSRPQLASGGQDWRRHTVATLHMNYIGNLSVPAQACASAMFKPVHRGAGPTDPTTATRDI